MNNGILLAEVWNFGETFEETAKRELKEETGLIAESLEMIGISSGKETFRTYPNGDQLYDITAIFEVTKFSGKLKADGTETKDLKWFSPEQMPENLAPMLKNDWEKIKMRYA